VRRMTVSSRRAKRISSCVTTLSTVAAARSRPIEGGRKACQGRQAAWVQNYKCPNTRLMTMGQIMSATCSCSNRILAERADIDRRDLSWKHHVPLRTYSRIRAAIHAAADTIKV